MSKEIIFALGGNALGDDLVGQMKAIKITSQATVNLVAQGYEVIVTHGNGPQVGMINQAPKAAVGTEAHSPTLPMSVCVALNQGYIGYDLQNALREELFSRGTSESIATSVTQIEVDTNDSAFLNPARPVGPFFTEQETKQLARWDYTLKEDAGRGYHRVVASPKPVDIIEKETVRTLIDASQVVTTIGGSGIPIIREGDHLHGASAITDKDWANARLAEMIDVDILIIPTTVKRVAINFGKENEQWPGRLSLSDAERFIEEGYFTKGSMLPKVEATVLPAHFRAGHEALITVLNKAKKGIEGKTGTVTCQ